MEAGRPARGSAGWRGGELAVAGTVIVPVVDAGLGNSAYLVDLGNGRALAVDAPRDLRAALAIPPRDVA